MTRKKPKRKPRTCVIWVVWAGEASFGRFYPPRHHASKEMAVRYKKVFGGKIQRVVIKEKV